MKANLNPLLITATLSFLFLALVESTRLFPLAANVLGESTSSCLSTFNYQNLCGVVNTSNQYRSIKFTCSGSKTTQSFGTNTSCYDKQTLIDQASAICGCANKQPTPTLTYSPSVIPTPTNENTQTVPCQEIKLLEQKYCPIATPTFTRTTPTKIPSKIPSRSPTPTPLQPTYAP